ncbi:hypothetical protein [Sediminicoccus rosea]|uniref:Uncharacterized protein n=1 Tax=Sediminicoccus rosea TaxID=1225128 RepID=A0ABZ0PBS7_9PROT|nr:hypothetical protein [Sediminicoccus rosea]WPB83090.1 hypothetical protein R9Z33_13345 [Sediminicoccus rosea]
MPKAKAPDGEAEAASSVSAQKRRAAALLTEPTPNAAHRGASDIVTVEGLADLARRHLSEDERRELAKSLVADMPKRRQGKPAGAVTFNRDPLVWAFLHRQAAAVATLGSRLPVETAAREVAENWAAWFAENGGELPGYGKRRDVFGGMDWDDPEGRRALFQAIRRGYQKKRAFHDYVIAEFAAALGAEAWPWPRPPVTNRTE